MSMRRIYRKVAKEYGVTPKEVRQEIQHCITAAYTDPLNQNEITKAYQKRVPCKGSIIRDIQLSEENLKKYRYERLSEIFPRIM